VSTSFGRFERIGGPPRLMKRTGRMTDATNSQRYLLYVRRAGAGIAWKFRDCGITLSDERIAWQIGDEAHDTKLADIAEVHLQTNAVSQDIIAVCRIRFADGFELLVLSSGENGLHDAEKAALYRDFVRDLHGRLAAQKGAAIAFTAGYSNARRTVGLVLIVVCVLFFLGLPTVLLLMSGELSMLSALYFGGLLIWPLYRVVSMNEAQTYDPRALPAELIET
jgi:hypothetical protein